LGPKEAVGVLEESVVVEESVVGAVMELKKVYRRGMVELSQPSEWQLNLGGNDL